MSTPITLPNCLSATRLVLAPIMVVALISKSWWVCFFVFYLAVLSDLLDGPLARRLNQVSVFGAKMDHTADAVFAFSALLGLSLIGTITWLLCTVQCVSFLLYFAESLLPTKPLRSSVLGKVNGIGYFFVAGIPITQSSLGFSVIPPPILTSLVYLLIVSSLVSIVQRYVTRLSIK